MLNINDTECPVFSHAGKWVTAWFHALNSNLRTAANSRQRWLGIGQQLALVSDEHAKSLTNNIALRHEA